MIEEFRLVIGNAIGVGGDSVAFGAIVLNEGGPANKEVRHLRATFNYGKKKKIIDDNPSDGIEFFPVEKKNKHVPRAEDMDNNSVPIGAIQKILEHENRTTTEIYLHSIGRTEQEAISVFERATQNSHTDSHTAEKTMGHPHTAHMN
jgi:hypothetical protein